VHVETKKPIGKERPVDPTGTAEGLTFEQTRCYEGPRVNRRARAPR
jgi:hypothetical protein